ncbi:MAG: AhpA/YtjB family protein [Candidatus Malihini olakiniferum]
MELILFNIKCFIILDRLSIDNKKVVSYYNYQIVHPINSKDGSLSFLRMMFDIYVLLVDSK